MIDFLIGVVTHPAFGAATFFIGLWSGNHFAIGRDRRKEHNDAVNKFRDAFKSELLSLNTSLTENYIDACDLLKPAFEKHRLAIFDFRPFLKGKKQKGFDQAWRNYYGYDGNQKVKIEFLFKYSGDGYEGEESRNRRSLAISNIEKLLEFAEHK